MKSEYQQLKHGYSKLSKGINNLRNAIATTTHGNATKLCENVPGSFNNSEQLYADEAELAKATFRRLPKKKKS